MNPSKTIAPHRSAPCLIHVKNATVPRKLSRNTRQNSLVEESIDVIEPGSFFEGWIEVFRRISSARINHIRLLEREQACLGPAMEIHGLAPRAAKYMAWRRSTLLFTLGPLLASTSLHLWTLAKDLEWSSFIQRLGMYVPILLLNSNSTNGPSFFRPLFILWKIQHVLYSFTLVSTLVGIACALYYWNQYRVSMRIVRYIYIWSFLFPFVIFTCLPFRQSVDFPALQLALCQDQVVQWNLDSGLQVDPDLICLSPPQEWIANLEQSIASSGRELDPVTRTCPAALALFDVSPEEQDPKSSLHSSPVCTDPDICGYCFASDSPCVALAAVILYGAPDPRSSGKTRPESSERSTKPIILERCERCYVPQEALANHSCMSQCQDLYVPQTLGQQLSSTCVSKLKPAQVTLFETLVNQLVYAQYFVGSFVGISALQVLFPTSVSLMFGSIKGARVSKTLAPWSRLPGHGLGASIVLGMPILCSLAISLNQVLGNVMSLLGLVAFVVSLAIWFPLGHLSRQEEQRVSISGSTVESMCHYPKVKVCPKLSRETQEPQRNILLEPQGYNAVMNEIATRHRLSVLAKGVALAFFTLFLLQSDIGRLVQTEVRMVLSKEEHANTLLSQWGETMTSFVLDLWGKAFLSAVVFGDIHVDLFVHVTTGDMHDRASTQKNREELALALRSLQSTGRFETESEELSIIDTTIISIVPT